jgi:hypothetical protein
LASFLTWFYFDSGVYFKSLPTGFTFHFIRLVKFTFFMVKTNLLCSKQVMKLIFRLFGYYYQSDHNTNTRFQTFKIPLWFRTNRFVFKIIFSRQGNFRNLVSENLGMMVHGMDSIHIQILQAKAHTKVLKLNFFSLKLSYLHLMNTNTDRN